MLRLNKEGFYIALVEIFTFFSLIIYYFENAFDKVRVLQMEKKKVMWRKMLMLYS